MQFILHFRYFLFACIISTVITIADDEDDSLGLVANIGKFKLATDIERSFLSVTVLANSTLQQFSQYIDRINTSVLLPNTIAGLKADTDLRDQYYTAFFPGASALTDIAIDLEIISNYVDINKRNTPNFPCHTFFDTPNDYHFLELANTLEFATKTLKTTWSTEDLKTSPAQELLINFISDAKLDILNLATLVRLQLQILDELTSGTVPPALVTFLQQQLECYPIGLFETPYLIACEKNEIGITCDIEVEIYKTISEYNRLLPVNYNGVEIFLGNNSVLVQQDSVLSLLNCPTISEINVCSRVDYTNKCGEQLLTKNYAHTIEHCNFTLKAPPHPFLTNNGGVMIMNKDFELQLFKDSKKIKTIQNKSPLLIFSKYIISIIHKGIEQKFINTINNNIVDKIIYSNINETLLQLMRLKAIKKAISDWDMYSILQYMALSVHVAIFPVALVSCCVSLKALKAYKPLKRSLRLLKKGKSNSPIVKRANYMHNKKYRYATGNSQ